jgi:hypothetical protein
VNKNFSEINSRGINISNTIQGLRDWFSYLLGKWWIIFFGCLIAGILGFIKAYFEKPKYQSSLTFSLEDGESGLGGALSLAAEFGFNIGGASNLFQGDNILSLLSSRRIVERVLLSTDTVNGKPITMAEYYKKISVDTTRKKRVEKLSVAEQRINSVSFSVGQPRNSFSYLQDSVLLNLCNDFIVDGALSVGKPDKKLNLFQVSVTSLDERFSKVFTDKLVNEAIGFYTELKTKKSKATLTILEERVAETRGSLNKAITTKATIQDADLNPAFQVAQAEMQKKQVDISAFGGAYGELYKNLELARYQYLKDIPLLQVIDPADYPMKRIKPGKIKTAVIFAIIVGIIIVLILTVIQIVKKELLAQNSGVGSIIPDPSPLK